MVMQGDIDLEKGSEFIYGMRSVALSQEDVGKNQEVGTRSIRVSSETPSLIPVIIDGKERMVNEVLLHDEESIDVTAMRSVLYDHDRNMIIGSVRGTSISNRTLMVDYLPFASARLASGVTADEAVESGALRGASLSYRYKRSDVDYDKESNTITVRKWRAMEATLTPVPEDVGSEVIFRSADGASSTLQLFTQKPDKKESIMDNESVTEEGQGQRSAPVNIPKHEHVESVPSAPDPQEVAVLAEGLGLKASEYLGCRSVEEAQRKMLDDVRDHMGSRHTAPTAPPSQSIEFTVDSVDKAVDAAANYIGARAGVGKIKQGNPLAGQSSIKDAAVIYAEMLGARGAHRWSDKDKACFALGDFRNMTEGARSAVNITTASFPDFINSNIVTKIVAEGLEQNPASITYPLWTRRREVPDFKQYRYGKMGTANMGIVGEGESFPELNKSEGFYDSSVNKWGGTLHLSIEALVNDDTGEFMESLAMAPFILQKTKEKRAFERLLSASWSGNTTVGDIQYETADEIVAARKALDAVISGFMTKKGLDGNPLNNPPAIILAPTALAGQARGITSGVAPGQPNTAHQGAMDVIQSAWLSSGSLSGSSASSYYLLADPRFVRGMTEAVLSGYPGIVVDERDPGKVGGRLWTMWSAFEFDLPVINGIVAGAHRGTAA